MISCSCAYTLVEVMIVVLLLGIVGALAIPMLRDSRDLRLRSAARMLAADIEFAQQESISHADDPRVVRFDAGNARYWIAPVSDPTTPITDPIRDEPFQVVFGTGRAAGLFDVTMSEIEVGGDTDLRFNSLGVPDQSTDATITLACGTMTLTVGVAASTGEVSIQSAP
jgi:prepilin-type N-terminal cleavage/methylation domain-containing protein